MTWTRWEKASHAHVAMVAGLAVATATVLLAVAPHVAAEQPPAAGDQLAVYSGKIRPLLAERCFSCHGGLKQEAGLRLDTVALMLAGGDSGPAVVKGEPATSLLVERTKDHDPATRMPPEGEGVQLSAEQLAMLEAWIAAGCPAPPDEKPEADPRQHWAFQPRVRPEVPTVKDAAGVRNPIDAFLVAAREQAGVVAQAEAPRHVLVRRLYVDLIGLPPQPEELAALEADTSTDWYEKLVDRLLADPRHGERWARHWMDVWRYSDWWGLGDQHRNSHKHMWHFRDWIVENLNADTGYDEMVRQILAADEIYPDDLSKLRATGFLARNFFVYNRNLWLEDTVEHVGKGLLGLTMNCSKCHAHKYDPIQQEDYYRFRAFFEPIQGRMDVVPGEGDLEKNGIPRVYDGLLEEPTYLFVRGDSAKPDTSKPMPPGVPDVIAFRELAVRPVPLPKTSFKPELRPWVIDAHVESAQRAVAKAEAEAKKTPTPAAEQAVAAAKAELAATELRVVATRAALQAEEAVSAAADDPLRARAKDAAAAAAKAEREAAVARGWAKVAAVSADLALAAAEKKNAAKLQLIEKDLTKAREELKAAVEAAEKGGDFTPIAGGRWTPTRFKYSREDDPTVPFPETSTGRRRALAEWMVDPRNPLVARVAVNHIWMRHLGKPLVSTVFNFGRKGNAPVNPQLLDWLASELVDHGWSMKRLHRLIVTSAAYRMGSSLAGVEASGQKDSENTLLWRREPIRLEAQVVRDGILALAGTLDPTPGGPPVPEAEQAESRRRSLYFWHSDISRNLFLVTFDDAAVNECYQRDQSIVPQQALALANSAIVHDAASRIAARLGADGSAARDDVAFIDRTFVTLLGRGPLSEERAACQQALATWRADVAPDAKAEDPARPLLVWSLFNHNDFVTLR